MSSGNPGATDSPAPRTANADRAPRTIRGEGGSRAAMLWGMAAVWNLAIWAVLALLWGDPNREAMLKVAFLFAVIGLILLVAAVRAALSWRRFGSSILELETRPGIIGGSLNGRIRTRVAKPPAAPVQLTLDCLRQRTSERRVGAGSPGRTSSTVRTDRLWQGGSLVEPGRLEPGPEGLAIPVNVLIPHGLPDSSDADPDDRVIWKLGATADLPGVDFAAVFTVPVFVTDESDPGLTGERVDELSEHASAFTQPVSRESCWVPPVVVQPGEKGGVRYIFRLAVTLKTALAVSALAVAVTVGSAALFVWLGKAGPFALVPGALGALLLLAAIVIWTFASRVTVENGTVEVRKSVLCIPRTWRVPESDVEKVHTKREGDDWKIEIVRRSGPEVDLGATIPTRDDALRVARDIERAIAATAGSAPGP